jgi:AraC-like DNA-binding protein
VDRRIYRRSLFISFFFATALIIIGLTLSLSGFFSMSYEHDLLNLVRQGDRETLLQLNIYLSELLDFSRASGVALLLDPSIIDMVNNPSSDQYTLTNKLGTIRRRLAVYPYINSAVFADAAHQKWFFTKTRREYDAATFIDPQLRDSIARGEDRHGLIPRTLKVQDNGISLNENLLTLVIFDSPILRGACVAINIDAQGLGSRMEQVSRGSSTDNDIFLVDYGGIITAHSKRERFGSSIGNTPLYSAILRNKQDEGTFTSTDRGDRLVVSYVKRNDGYLIRTSAYAQIFASLVNMRMKIAGACLLALAVFLSAAFALQRRLLRPLRTLTDKIERIAAARDVDASRDNEVEAIDHAFTITIEHLESLRQLQKSANEHLQAQVMEDLSTGRASLESLRCDRSLESLGLSGLVEPAGGLFMVAIRGPRSADTSQPRRELRQSGFQVFWNGSGCLIALSDSPAQSDHAAIEALLGPLVSGGCECAVGSNFPSLRDLPEAYAAIQRLVSLWFFSPDSPGIFWQCQRNPDILSGFSYPVVLEEKAQESLRLQRLNDTRDFTNRFLEQLPKEDYESAMVGITRFSTAVFEAINSMKEMRALPVGRQFGAFLAQLHQARYLRDVSCLFSGLYDQIETALLASSGSRSIEIAQRIRELIDKHAKNPNLSVKFLAELVKLTPAYAGQVFRQVFGLSIAQYLLDLRLKQARELIATSDDSIKDIAGKIGIENYKYFYTRYKAHFGISPGREKRSPRQ